MNNIDIILPYKELFTPNGASAVSISVKNSIEYSKNKKIITVYGQYVHKPFAVSNFVGFKSKKIFHFGNNLSVLKQYLNQINLKQSDRIIEIHNRPYLFNYLLNKNKHQCVILYFHNDPLSMKGSKTKIERIKILSKASGIVFVSKYLRDKFFSDINENFDNEYIIPNSLNKNHSIIEKKKQKIILFVGRIVKEKGVDIYVKVAKKLSTKYSDWKFLIIGSSKLGYENKSLFEKSMITEIEKHNNNVVYQGYITNKRVKDIMSKSSILIVPSLWEEPFGMTALEGLANKMVVISSEVGGLTEIVKERGIVIKDIDTNKLENKLENLLNFPEEIKKYQMRAWSNYSYDQKEISIFQDEIRDKIFKKFNNSIE